MRRAQKIRKQVLYERFALLHNHNIFHPGKKFRVFGCVFRKAETKRSIGFPYRMNDGIPLETRSALFSPDRTPSAPAKPVASADPDSVRTGPRRPQGAPRLVRHVRSPGSAWTTRLLRRRPGSRERNVSFEYHGRKRQSCPTGTERTAPRSAPLFFFLDGILFTRTNGRIRPFQSLSGPPRALRYFRCIRFQGSPKKLSFSSFSSATL